MAFILAGFTFIALIDFIPILKRHSRRTAVAFLLLFIPALALSVLQALDIDVPSTLLILGHLLKSAGLSY